LGDRHGECGDKISHRAEPFASHLTFGSQSRVVLRGSVNNELNGFRPRLTLYCYCSLLEWTLTAAPPKRGFSSCGPKLDWRRTSNLALTNQCSHNQPFLWSELAIDALGCQQLGNALRNQYDALASPIPPHLASLVKQLEAQK
jgi:hypothetical protein